MATVGGSQISPALERFLAETDDEDEPDERLPTPSRDLSLGELDITSSKINVKGIVRSRCFRLLHFAWISPWLVHLKNIRQLTPVMSTFRFRYKKYSQASQTQLNLNPFEAVLDLLRTLHTNFSSFTKALESQPSELQGLPCDSFSP